MDIRETYLSYYCCAADREGGILVWDREFPSIERMENHNMDQCYNTNIVCKYHNVKKLP